MSDLAEFLRARLAEDETAASVASSFSHYSPARVLAEVAAKRQIIGRYEPYHWHAPPMPNSPDPGDHAEDRGACRTCVTNRLLALPYDQHPDYQEAWRV